MGLSYMVADIVVTGVKRAIKAVEDDAKQTRFAASRAMNQIARPIIRDQQKEMRRAFDRPTPFILNSLRVSKSPKRNDLELRIAVKDIFSRGAFDPLNDTLGPNIDARKRLQKRHEVALRKAGIISSNEFVIPSRTAPLNRFGNISKAIMGKIVDDLTRGSTRRKRQYVLGEVGNVKGIFRIGGGFDRLRTNRWKLILLIVRGAPRYRRIYDFFKIGEDAFLNRFEPAFESSLDRALATARR